MSAAGTPIARAMAMMPPVEVPVIRSKCSTIFLSMWLSKVASAEAEKVPNRPPPSKDKIRKVLIVDSEETGHSHRWCYDMGVGADAHRLKPLGSTRA